MTFPWNSKFFKIHSKCYKPKWNGYQYHYFNNGNILMICSSVSLFSFSTLISIKMVKFNSYMFHYISSKIKKNSYTTKNKNQTNHCWNFIRKHCFIHFPCERYSFLKVLEQFYGLVLHQNVMLYILFYINHSISYTYTNKKWLTFNYEVDGLSAMPTQRKFIPSVFLKFSLFIVYMKNIEIK